MSTDRVLMLAYEDIAGPIGGLGVHVWNLAKQIKDDVELTIVCTHADGRSGFFLCNEEQIEEVDREHWQPRPGWYRFMYEELFQTGNTKHPLESFYLMSENILQNVLYYLGNEKFNLIHLHDSSLWIAAKQLRALWKIPIVYTCHLSYALSMDRAIDTIYRFGMQNDGAALHESDHIITVSKYYKQQLIDELLVWEEGITVIYNGVEIPSVMRKAQKKTAVFIGRCVPSKGVRLIIDAAKRLKDWQFVLYSSVSPTLEDDLPVVKRLKKAIKKQDNIVWHKHHTQEQKMIAMSGATVGIVPSLHEPFGIVALEWLAAKVPLLTTAQGGLAEFCTKENSVLFPPTVKGLVTALRSFKKNEKLIKNGYETAKKFAWDKVGVSTLRIYRRMYAVHSH